MRAAIGDREVIDTDRAYVLEGEAWLALAEGDPPRAWADPHGGRGADGRDPDLLGAALPRRAAGGSPRRGRWWHRSASSSTRCDARLTAAYADHAEALAAADGPRLLACADEFEDIGVPRLALECAAEAAQTFAAAGRQDSARRAATRMRELDPGQGGFLPAVSGLDDAAMTLTAREAQIVELRRARPVERGDRRPARALRPHRRDAHLPGDEQARRQHAPRAT